MVPQFRTGSPNVRDKLPRIALVQVANCRGQHHEVTRRETISQNQLPHGGLFVGPDARQKIRRGNLSRPDRVLSGSVIGRPVV
jgi:hypothetical protein